MSSQKFSVLSPRTQSMTTRDGTVLVADIWEPDAPGPFPVLMMRQAYGRKIGTSLCYASPHWYAAHGYIVLMQDARGRGESGGDFDLFVNEARDGADSVAWAASLPKANGRVGMFGFSFQGTNQLLAASVECPALRAIAPAMIGWDLRTDWAYENGAFPLRANLGWATQLAAETARLAGDHDAQGRLFAASRALSFAAPAPAKPAFIDLLEKYSHYGDWMRNADDGPYWEAISPAKCAAQIARNAPAMFLIGGWYDSHLPGTIAAWKALSPHIPSGIAIGPWGHFPWDRRVGDLDLGNEAIGTIDQQQIAWFDHWLKDGDGDTGPRVSLFDLGRKNWRAFDELPSARETFFLRGTGRAAIDTRDGRLEAPLADLPDGDAPEFVTLDPWRPAGPCGGSFGFPVGPVDRAMADARSDTLTFTTAAFERARLLVGEIEGHFEAISTAQSFDFHAVLSRVDRLGRVHPLGEGFATVGKGQVTMSLRANCCTIEAGESLRLSIALSCFPAFPVNPGTGIDPWEATLADLRVVTVALRCNGASSLVLPLLELE